ncbi:alpha/beta fold hydrolase [Enterococcus pseudoavium]|uniref:Alpha/beta fold hydrolase n=1 Tax=Enterococcus pseudoavium TaxID=44007 RepID=A0ABU3FF37_9ENTE|nr:alpha/beta hydrolase [Enterococcus pseudoavium]MDT2754475.1 alpha/beta fold hydrolase [Enterococcus pseudoavium]MDT2769469.1 alpha/beta fold hydrolase [Enterococcus pseudoavium]REC31040.1 alpha/beta hydrolase [Enterococcus pseudoavium]
MKLKQKKIQGIPVICWGEPSEKIILAFHGDQSHKEDPVIQFLADVATKKGYQVWSFDLPEHGERKGQDYALNPQNVVADVNKILLELEKQAARIALFGCSIGAYFSMLTCQNRSIEQSLFLSPIVDMQKLIENIMRWSDLTPTDLRQKKIIETPIKTLEWEYYSYVVDHPITSWTAPTAILYGGQDTLTERGTIETFAAAPQISLTIFEAGEHFFHTPDQLQVYQQWLEKKLK